MVFDMAGDDIVANLSEALFPTLAFPAVRRIGVYHQAWVVVAGVDQHKEIIGARSRGAGMNFVGQSYARPVSMVANFSRFFDEPFQAFLNQVIVGSFP